MARYQHMAKLAGERKGVRPAGHPVSMLSAPSSGKNSECAGAPALGAPGEFYPDGPARVAVGGSGHNSPGLSRAMAPRVLICRRVVTARPDIRVISVRSQTTKPARQPHRLVGWPAWCSYCAGVPTGLRLVPTGRLFLILYRPAPLRQIRPKLLHCCWPAPVW